MRVVFKDRNGGKVMEMYHSGEVEIMTVSAMFPDTVKVISTDKSQMAITANGQLIWDNSNETPVSCMGDSKEGYIRYQECDGKLLDVCPYQRDTVIGSPECKSCDSYGGWISKQTLSSETESDQFKTRSERTIHVIKCLMHKYFKSQKEKMA
jgi:hypothetical protein